jgi:hypothetical protein
MIAIKSIDLERVSRQFPTILRNVTPTERPYPFLKRNLKAYAPDRRSLNRRKEWELDLFCSKRDSEEDLLSAW